MDNLSDFDKQLIEWCNSSNEYKIFIDFEDAVSGLHVYVNKVQPLPNTGRDLVSCFNGNLFVRIILMRNGIKLIFSDGNNFLNIRRAINLLNIDFRKLDTQYIMANVTMCSEFLESVKDLNLEFL